MSDLSKLYASAAPEAELAVMFAECGDARERGELQRRISEVTGWSRNKVYELARQGGWSSGRKTRADQGKWELSNTQVQQLAALTKKSKRKGRRMIAPAEVVLDVAEMNGIISKQVSPATLCRYLRNLNLSRQKQREAIDKGTHTNIATEHPNQEWQVDVTPCVQFYFNKKGLKVDNSIYDPVAKNKTEALDRLNKRHKILRYVCVDHYSGAFYVRYYNAPGENSGDALDFIIRTMRPKSDRDRYPFRGVPLQICADRGGAFKNYMLQNFLDHLECNLYLHAPENPNRKGAVEGFMNAWEQYFESRLSYERINNLDELNELAELYCLRYNSEKKHRRHGHTRTAMWSTIKNDELRNLPEEEAVREIISLRPETRKVNSDRSLEFNTEFYFVADPALIGETVIVRRNPWARDEVTVEHDGYRYRCPLIGRDDAGFRENAINLGTDEGGEQPEHSHAANTPAMRAVSELPEVPQGLRGFNRSVEDIQVASLGGRRKGEDVELEPSGQIYDNTGARIRLLKLLEREEFTSSEIAWLDNNWPGQVDEKTIKATAETFTGADDDLENQVR